MSEPYKVPDDVRCKPVEYMKVSKDTIEWLKNNSFVNIEDVIARQKEIPDGYCGKVLAFLIFGAELK